MKRLLKQGKLDLSNMDKDELKEISDNISSWVSGGRSWFDEPNAEVEKWMKLFPDYVVTSDLYRLLSFTGSEVLPNIKKIYGDDIIEKCESGEIENETLDIRKINQIMNDLVIADDNYVSWTKDYNKHLNFYEFYKDMNGDDYLLISIKTKNTGFYITEFVNDFNLAYFNKTKDEYINETLEYDGCDYTEQDEVIAPMNSNYEIILINKKPEISLYDLIDFIK